MKTRIITSAKRAILISTIFLGLQLTLVMAKPANGEPAKNNPVISAPVSVTPKTSSPVDALRDNGLNMSALAPTTPKEATLSESDNPIELTPEILKKLAPVTPSEAIINDSTLQFEFNFNTLKFTVPTEAKFGDF